MAIVFVPPPLRMHCTTLSVYIQFVCKLDFVNILPVLNILKGKLERSACACTSEGHDRIVEEKQRNTSHTRDMNYNWQKDAVTLPTLSLVGNPVDDDDDDDDDGDGNDDDDDDDDNDVMGNSSSSETHSDSASMPYQYLIERDIERERKNLRIAKGLTKKSVATSSSNDVDISKDACVSKTCQGDRVAEVTKQGTTLAETSRFQSFGENDISNSCNANIDDSFCQSIRYTFANYDENEEVESTMEEEDIVPEALVNSSFFNDSFQTMGKDPLTSHYEGLLMDDMEPNDEKIVHENGFTKIIMPSSSNYPFMVNGSSFVKDSSMLPKVTSTELITNDETSEALCKSSIKHYRNKISICNNAEGTFGYNNKSNCENMVNEKEIDTENSIKSNIIMNMNNFKQDNMRPTRSSVKLHANYNELLSTCNGSSSRRRSSETTWTQKPFERSCNRKLNEDSVYKTEAYENRFTNTGDNSLTKNSNSANTDEALDKRVKINTQKLISDLTYGIKVVVERLDLSSIPR